MNTFSSRLLRTYAVGIWASASISACTATIPSESAGLDDESLIGGFPADSPTLDAVGMIGFMSVSNNKLSGPVSPNCTGALVTSSTVVTAKHCIEQYATMPATQAMVFSIGANLNAPKQTSRVVEVEGAPGDKGGFVARGHDVAVLHLEQPITGVTFTKIGVVADDQLGEDFVSIGYGRPDNVSMPTQRLVGAGQLHATSGKTYEAMYGSFEEYFRARFHADPADCPKAPTAPPVPTIPAPSPAPTTPVVIVTTSDPCSSLARARQDYDSLLLETSAELVITAAEGDAQPCNGDSGGPLLQRTEAGELISYGVVSGGGSSNAMRCDYGTVYASFKAPEVKAFVEEAMQWTDPCADLKGQAACDGSVARRCSTPSEGKRRVVDFDCESLGLACLMGADGSVSCAEEHEQVAAE